MLSTHARQGSGLIAAGRPADGVKAFQEGLALDPDDVECLLGLARVRLMEGALEEARGYLVRLTGLQPQHAEAGSHLAFIRFKAGDRSALRQLRAAASSPSAGPFELVNLARALEQAGESAEAGAAFKQAALLESTSGFLRMEAGEAALGRGDAPAAVAHYQAAVEASPDQYLLRAYLAKAHAMAGELEKALDQLSSALQMGPTEPALHEEMFLLRERMVSFPEALAEADWLCERFPENLRYMFWRGVSLKRIGKLAEARPVLESVVALSSRSAEARQALAEVCFRQQDLAQAQALLEDALRMDPLSAAVAVDLGNVYLAQGAPDKAEKVLTRALGMHPNQAPVHYNLALALAAKDRERALTHARKAASARDPSLRVEAEKLIAELAVEPPAPEPPES